MLSPVLFAAVLLAPVPAPARAEESLTTTYRETADRILQAALADEEGYEKLSYLTTEIGHRLSGSPGLERAIEWAFEKMREEELESVMKLPVQVPRWVRGNEHARVVAPVDKPLSILGLGSSIGTGDAPLTASVVAVRSFEELASIGREGVEGKIVLYAVPWMGYGETVQYRASGASRAGDLGAVAALVRSATGRSLYTPHTGSLRYDEGSPRIPAAAVTAEDAEWMARLIEAGHEVRVELSMEARMLPDVESFNIVAEIRGREKPEEVVVMGGHFDSWDVGQGAHDDGAACMAAWQALTLLKRLSLVPRRTLRVVLWTNEENGLRGGRAYREWLGDEVSRHVAAIEMDGGAERPIGFGLGLRLGDKDAPDSVYENALEILRPIGALLEAIDASEMNRGGGGADIGPLMAEGVPGLGLRTVGEHYFDWHHTHADTLDKVDRDDFRKAMAMLAVVGFVLADMPGQVASK
ncbi:MAG: M20/M25/M40 family metallo-hydrolase [Vicinamibacteria bacterium]